MFFSIFLYTVKANWGKRKMEVMEISLESGGEEGIENRRFMLVGMIIAEKILNMRGLLQY